MKVLSLLVGVLMTGTAFAQTVIIYDDGSTYTVKPDQEIYISDKGVYSAMGGLKNWLRIIRMEPWSNRDWVETPSYDVCESGLTFGHQNCPTEEETDEQTDGGDFTFGG